MSRKVIVLFVVAGLSAGPAGAQSISLGGTGVNVGIGGLGVAAGLSGGGVAAGLSGGGVSVGAGGVAGGVSVGAGPVGGVGSGLAAGSGLSGSGVSAGAPPGGATVVSGGAAAGVGLAPGTGLAGSVALPVRLIPGDDRSGRPQKLVPAKIPGLGIVRVTEQSVRRGAIGPLPAANGTPMSAVAACRQALAQAALPYGAVHAAAASAGPMRSASGMTTAPIEMRIVYAREGAYEVRQSRVQCRLAGGQVVGVS